MGKGEARHGESREGVRVGGHIAIAIMSFHPNGFAFAFFYIGAKRPIVPLSDERG